MSYRRMTEVEVQTFVEEFTAYQTWQAFASYAVDVYGSAAEQVEVVTGSEYNEEYSFLVLASVEVRDARGRPLEPDLSTDWWQTVQRGDYGIGRAVAGERAEYYLDDEDAREDWLADVIGERRAALPVLSGGYDTFTISQPPKRTHRNIYAPE
jgi:hypothetical protein